MNNELEEALKFFGLDKDFTRDDWSDTYRLLGKKNHPDVNHETEEYMKLINNYKAILKSYELQNRLAIKQRLDDKKDKFAKKLQDDKKKYNYSSITSLVNKYLALLKEVEGFKKLEELKKSYSEELNSILLNIKKKEEFNLNHKKENYTKYFASKFYQFAASHKATEIAEANKILGLVLDLILKSTADNIDDLIRQIGNISFEDIIHDQEILNGLNVNYEVYINKNHGHSVLVEKIDDEKVYYRRYLNDDLVSMNYLKFKQDFLSLRSFIEESEYVGNHDVYMIGNGLRRKDLPLSRYLYYHPRSGLMLVYKEDDKDEKFGFYSGNVSHGLEDIGYHFEIDFDSRRNDPEQGAFKNRDFLYESIMKEIIAKNSNLEMEETKGKK
ncbi:MAG: hypothetical protein ACI4WF_03475 [Bacilli bacterium]